MPFWNTKKLGIWNGLFGIGLTLSVLGIIFIYSAENSQHHRNFLYIKQLLSVILAILVYLVVSRCNYHLYSDLSIWIYLGGIALLIAVLIFGVRINGAKSWVNFGFYNGQLAEFSKVAFILSFAHILTKYQEQIRMKMFFFLAFLFLSCYLFFLILQPDFGTAVIFFFIFLIMLFAAGGNIEILLFLSPVFFLSVLIPFVGFWVRTFFSDTYWVFLDLSAKQMIFIGLIFALLGAVFLAVHNFMQRMSSLVVLLSLVLLGASFFGGAMFKTFLRDYHYQRILVTLKPDLDPARQGYNLNQSLISIGGGKFLGYGLMKGPQNRGNFLPANQTDFILSVIAEEWGFVGVILIITLNVLLIYQLIKIAINTRDRFGFLILVGIAGLFISHFLINVLSVTGFLPIIGIPLPFLSYGGSFIMSCFICLGIANNIRTSRYRFKEFG